MERMRDGMRLGCLGFWLNCCLLAGCLGLWLAWRTFGRRLGLWLGGFARLGSLAGFLFENCLGLWLAFCLKTAWGSGSTDPEKVPAFFEFAGTFFDAKPIETHRRLFSPQQSGLTRELFPTEFHIDPRTSLRDTARNCLFPYFKH